MKLKEIYSALNYDLIPDFVGEMLITNMNCV